MTQQQQRRWTARESALGVHCVVSARIEGARRRARGGQNTRHLTAKYFQAPRPLRSLARIFRTLFKLKKKPRERIFCVMFAKKSSHRSVPVGNREGWQKTKTSTLGAMNSPRESSVGIINCTARVYPYGLLRTTDSCILLMS